MARFKSKQTSEVKTDETKEVVIATTEAEEIITEDVKAENIEEFKDLKSSNITEDTLTIEEKEVKPSKAIDNKSVAKVEKVKAEVSKPQSLTDFLF